MKWWITYAFAVLVALTGIAVADSKALLLDDFSDPAGRSSFGTSWRGFTDRVMGGVSEMQAAIVDTERGPAMRMTGRVRLENNGGFIQARLPLERGGEPLDASGFDAVRVVLRGAPGAYFLHTRTPDSRRPWQYYRAALPIEEDWQTFTIPFDDFTGESIRGTPDWSRLNSIAVVAYGEAFEARIEVASIELIETR